jgi:xanthine dehydrogenase accessory factor
MDRKNLEKLNRARHMRHAAMSLTDLSSGECRVVREDELIGGVVEEGDLVEALTRAFRSGKSTIFNNADKEYFINAYLPPPRIVVIGAVHISQALAPIAAITGYDLEIIDPRTAFATPERFPDVALHADWPEQVLAEKPLDAYCALAAITHDPKIDDPALIAAIKADCFYVGALGSRKTHAKRVTRLIEAGLSEAQLERIAAPIGLDIGASSPQEIAVAIMAEIISAYHGRGLIAHNAAEEERMLDA